MSKANADGIRDALKVAAKLNLFSDDDAKLASEILNCDFELSDDPEKWIDQIKAKLAELERTLQQTPYHRYLNGGPGPITFLGNEDWYAKYKYDAIQTSITHLVGFRERINSSLRQRIGGTTTLAIMLKVAIDLTKIYIDLQQTKADTNQLVKELPQADDIRLCLTWADHVVSTTQYLDVNYLVTELGDYEANRLLSARIAEHAATNFYKALGHEVLDVSIDQLRSSDDRWKDYDLLISGRPIDVKNARYGLSNHDSYVEHCVPRFKKSRASGAEVSITGVLSEYSTVDKLAGSISYCRILGEVTVSEIRHLYVWARARFGYILNIDGIWKPEYQPGWVFEYPPEHYPRRNNAIADIPNLIEELKASGISADRLPSWLLPLCPDRDLASSMARSNQTKRILSDLHSLHDHIGFSRPGLFIYVMGLFLESIANGEQGGQLNKSLRELIFIPGSSFPRPLGLEDSQNYVVNLVDNLVQVQDEALRQNIKITSFRLTHPSILLGQSESGSWITLLAYCGGWRAKPVRARCGSTPLVFGQHEVCPNCGHLICDDCGYCSHSCDLVVRRQSDVATRQRISNEDDYFG